MGPVTVLALVVGVGGFLVVVYFTTELATLYFGADPLPAGLRPLVAHVNSENRFVRTVVLVLFLLGLESVVAAVLLTRRTELGPLEQVLFAVELVAATTWTLWLSARYRRRVSRH